jgi:alpha-tubulin suppressor-like RCC1 family protein
MGATRPTPPPSVSRAGPTRLLAREAHSPMKHASCWLCARFDTVPLATQIPIEGGDAMQLVVRRAVCFATLVIALTACRSPGRATQVLSVGDVSSCAVISDGTVNCWGMNQFGQLGIGSSDSKRHPPTPVVGLKNAVAVGVGRFFACALTESGTASCWGANFPGWLGNNSTSASYTPQLVLNAKGNRPLAGASALSVGANHSCVIVAGDVYCWGVNADGQLGDGTNVNRATPVQATSGLGIVSVAVGDNHTCALALRGEVWCWGRNDFGQLGDGTQNGHSSPTQSLVTSASAITAGNHHSCAVVGGSVNCFGANSVSQSGDGKGPIFAVNGLSNAWAVSAGTNYACSLDTRGNVLCWGDSSFDRLGGATRVGPSATGVFMGPTQVVALGTGVATTCVTTSAGEVLCWGNNVGGEAGDASAKPHASATPIVVALIGTALTPN